MQTSKSNIIVFGETGAGKSSVINMLAGEEKAKIGSDAIGVTFQTERYSMKIEGKLFEVYDTVGLSEGDSGTISASEAIGNLYELIRELHGGVSLLVYVLRGPRLRTAARKNYNMFYEIFCKKQVPIVIVITGLEEQKDMPGWWNRNQMHFTNQKMIFEGAACVTATRGKDGVYEREYMESRERLKRLVLRQCADEPWCPPTSNVSWLLSTAVGIINAGAKLLSLTPVVLAKAVKDALISCEGMRPKEASIEANNILKELKRRKQT